MFHPDLHVLFVRVFGVLARLGEHLRGVPCHVQVRSTDDGWDTRSSEVMNGSTDDGMGHAGALR